MKTEVIQTAIVGFLVLGDQISYGGLVAILLGLMAVLLLSKSPGGDGAWWKHLTNRASRLGLGSGVLFAFSAVSYRGASLELGDIDAWFRALITLAAVVTFQFLSMALWLLWRDLTELLAVWQTRRTGVFVGLTSLGGSFCWFFAFTLQNAAYVKALGQEANCCSACSHRSCFSVRPLPGVRIAGMALLGLSILALVLAI